MREAEDVIEEVGQQYKELFGSDHVGCIETEECEDAEVVVVTMGDLVAQMRLVVEALRQKGEKIGLVKLRVFRPFPTKALVKALEKARVVVVIERNSLAAVFSELKAALYGNGNKPSPLVLGRLVGIGGRIVQMSHISRALADGFEALETGKVDKDLDWIPIKSLDFDPFEADVGE